ncbi:MAG TPA: NUDIX domain-containing protein [Xanthobacteraceae bacterium]|nr:NUDIX domain-containing protein [Xanthobacteraceae bacterium]
MSRKAEVSAGLLVYRQTHAIEVLLAHPGGPFWAKKDAAAWTIPKGLVDPGEELLAAARREFTEETGFVAQAPFSPLAPVKQKSGKIVHAFACTGDFDPAGLTSNTFETEWPPRSGRRRSFPEIDRVAWFALAAAREKILAYQLPLLDQLAATFGKQAS